MNYDIKLTKVRFEDIRPYWRNARDNDAAVEGVLQSIKEFGYISPIIVDANLVIIAGHTRYKALQRLYITEVNVIVADLSEDQARGYRIIDNKSSELATWNIANLIPELRSFTGLEKFTNIYQDLKLETVDLESFQVKHEPITGHEIARATDKLNQHFSGISENRAKAVKTYVCPHCGEEFDTV